MSENRKTNSDKINEGSVIWSWFRINLNKLLKEIDFTD